jgi:HemY protein
LHPALSRRLREMAYGDLLDDRSRDAEAMRGVWAQIPAADRVQPFAAVHAAQAFIARGLHGDARGIIEKALAVEWDDRLVRAYRQAAAGEGTPELLGQIERCEQWLAERPDDPELALTLGALCLKQKLWGKAQRHLDQALSAASEPVCVREAHLKLAQLHEALGQEAQAQNHYRKCALATVL